MCSKQRSITNINTANLVYKEEEEKKRGKKEEEKEGGGRNSFNRLELKQKLSLFWNYAWKIKIKHCWEVFNPQT